MRLSLALAVVCLIGVGAFAQSNQGTITGTISDPAAAVVPGAQIGVKNTATGVVYSGGTSATGNYVLSVKTASDGSQVPTAILATTTTNVTSGPALAGAYVMGEFNQNAINFDPSWTLPQLQAAMRPYGIFLKSTVSATDPT